MAADKNIVRASVMDRSATIRLLMRADPPRWRILDIVRSLKLPDCWVGAGFVRNAVWDMLHERSACQLTGDVDVLWFDKDRADAATDAWLDAELRARDPCVGWSVKNQARMHLRNGDAPCTSTADALRYWPETATAVAIRRDGYDGCEIIAPFGLDDLFAAVLRPTPRFMGEKHNVYLDRVHAKGWLSAWPRLRMESG